MNGNLIYRQLLKAEAYLIVGAINDVVQIAQDGFADFTKPPHVGHASDDRIYGLQLKENFEHGVRERARSITNAIETELHTDQSDAFSQVIGGVSFGESLGQNVDTLKGITDRITKLVAKL